MTCRDTVELKEGAVWVSDTVIDADGVRDGETRELVTERVLCVPVTVDVSVSEIV